MPMNRCIYHLRLHLNERTSQLYRPPIGVMRETRKRSHPPTGWLCTRQRVVVVDQKAAKQTPLYPGRPLKNKMVFAAGSRPEMKRAIQYPAQDPAEGQGNPWWGGKGRKESSRRDSLPWRRGRVSISEIIEDDCCRRRFRRWPDGWVVAALWWNAF